jgi:hypothetical protein
MDLRKFEESDNLRGQQMLQSVAVSGSDADSPHDWADLHPFTVADDGKKRKQRTPRQQLGGLR